MTVHSVRTIDPQEKHEAKRLLAEGLSCAEVARITGLSIGYVGKLPVESNVKYRALRSPRRCPTCGNRVLLDPCLICVALAARKASEACRQL